MQMIKLLFTISKTRIVAVFAAGLVSGVANTYLLTLIGSVLSPETQHGTTWKRFAVTAAVALFSSLVSQLLLIRLTQDAIYQLRAQLSSRVLSAPLEQLERLGVHRLLVTLTETYARCRLRSPPCRTSASTPLRSWAASWCSGWSPGRSSR